MKTRHAVQVRRRLRFYFGWTLILSVAAVELWLMGSLVTDCSRMGASSPWPAAPPLVETLVAIR